MLSPSHCKKELLIMHVKLSSVYLLQTIFSCLVEYQCHVQSKLASQLSTTKLKKIDISLYKEIEFIREIIGYQASSHCFSGLGHCNSPDDLDNK